MAALTLGLAAPTGASAGLLDDLVGGVDNTVNQVRDGINGLGGSPAAPAPAPAPTPQAGVPPSYVPPEHGTNPHGQGTAAVVDLVPEDTEPLDPDASGEDVVVGQSRGEQNGDSYHGRIEIISVLGLDIPGITSIETDEGETENGPLGPLNDALDDLCTASGNSLCLNILAMESSTDSSGSNNSFSVADVNIGTGGFGISASAVESEGNINDDGTCQTSTGSSEVANANALNFVTADLLDSSSTSEACNDGSGDTQSNTSSGLNVLGTALPVPQAGCENGTPNTVFNPVLLNVLVTAVCNADDSNGSQTDDPNGVREALSVFLLPILGDVPVVKATTAAGESAAVAPEAEGPECPDPTNPGCPEPPEPECPDPSDPACDEPGDGGNEPDGPGKAGPGGPDGPDGPSADSPDDAKLPFTGADALSMALIGGGVMALGLVGMALADRRRRTGA